MARARIPLGKDGDLLTLALTPKYLHLKVTQPGKQFYVQEIYIPRRHLIGVIRWIIRSANRLPREGSLYPPDRVRRYLEAEELYFQGQRLLKAERRGQRRKRRQK